MRNRSCKKTLLTMGVTAMLAATAAGCGRGAGDVSVEIESSESLELSGASEMEALSGAESEVSETETLSGSESEAAETLELSGSESESSEMLELSGSESESSETLALSGSESELPERLALAGPEGESSETLALSGVEIEAKETFTLSSARMESLRKGPGELEEEEGSQAVFGTGQETVIRMGTPSWQYFYAGGDPAALPAAAPLSLTQISATTNQITDTDAWFEANGLTLESVGGAGWGEISTADETGWRCEILPGSDGWEAYQIRVTNEAKGESFILDFADYQYAEEYREQDYDYIQQRITYAQVKDGILYFSMGHPTYAESSPQNAFVTAVDLESRSVLWRSSPLVSNANNFQIVGDVMFCGYGFTAEPDYLYQLDLATGRTIAGTPLKSKADYIILKDQKLYVRTYHTDYVFGM